MLGFFASLRSRTLGCTGQSLLASISDVTYQVASFWVFLSGCSLTSPTRSIAPQL